MTRSPDHPIPPRPLLPGHPERVFCAKDLAFGGSCYPSPIPSFPPIDQLRFYTLSHGGPEFIHQYVVDAWTVQHADEHTKPIAITFALVGLYLCLEKHYSGKKVQQVHGQMAKRRKQWPTFPLPKDRGSVSVDDVMNAPAGPERDQAILRWCQSVWQPWSTNRQQIAKLLSDLQIVQ